MAESEVKHDAHSRRHILKWVLGVSGALVVGGAAGAGGHSTPFLESD